MESTTAWMLIRERRRAWSWEVQQLPFSRYLPWDETQFKNSTNPQNIVRKDEIRQAIIQAMLPPEDSGIISCSQNRGYLLIPFDRRISALKNDTTAACPGRIANYHFGAQSCKYYLHPSSDVDVFSSPSIFTTRKGIRSFDHTRPHFIHNRTIFQLLRSCWRSTPRISGSQRTWRWWAADFTPNPYRESVAGIAFALKGQQYGPRSKRMESICRRVSLPSFPVVMGGSEVGSRFPGCWGPWSCTFSSSHLGFLGNSLIP